MNLDLEKWRSGDNETFFFYFHRYKDMVFKTAFLITGSKEDAEDVLQQVFLATWKARHTFDPDKSKLSTWLTRITVRLAGKCRRKMVKGYSPAEVKIGNIPSPEEDALTRLEHQAMVKALGALPEKHRTVIILRYFNELSLNEIAAALGIPPGTVKSRLHQGLKKLHEKFYPAFQPESREKMNCKQVQKLLASYLEEELKGTTLAEFKRHLDNCPRCREELAALAYTRKRLTQTLKLLAAGAAPSALAAEKLWHRIEEKIKPAPLQRLRRQKAFALAAVILLIGLGLVFAIFPRQPLEARVAAIATVDPRLQDALGAGRVKAVGIFLTGRSQGLLTALVERNEDEDFQEVQITAAVDLKKKQVVKIEKLCPPLTGEERALALKIAQNDPAAQELLTKNELKNIVSAYPPLREGGVNTPYPPAGSFARLALENQAEVWLVRVDLATGKVVETTKGTFAKTTTKLKWDEESGRLEWDGEWDGEGGGFKIEQRGSK